MKSLSVVFLIFLVAIPIYAQTGSINNTLGSGGTFTVKNSGGSTIVGVDETTGQLMIERVKVSGVPSFLASHVQEDNLGTSHDLAAWNESASGAHDNSGNFNASTGVFTAPRNGYYFVSGSIELGVTGGSGASLYVLVNSALTPLVDRAGTPYQVANLVVSGILKLNAGDTVSLRVTMTASLGDASAITGYFSGYLVSDF